MGTRSTRLGTRLALGVGLGGVVACGPSGGIVGNGGTGDSGPTGGDATMSPTASGPTASTTASTTASSAAPTSGPPTTSAPDTGADATADGSGSDTGSPATCTNAGDQGCALAVDCGAFACGSERSWFDADGCLRRACSPDGSCPAGEACFTPEQWGYCVSSGVACQEQDGVCECASKPDCGGELCLPQAQVPPALCGTIEGQDACADAGCSPVSMARPILASGEACLCDLPQTRCLWVRPRTRIAAGPATAYLELASGDVVVFSQQYTPAPLGYVACTDLDPAPAACDCADVLPCAM